MLTVSLEDNMALMKRYKDKHFDLAIIIITGINYLGYFKVKK